MRTPKHLSHSAIDLFRRNRQEYFRRYISEYKLPKMGQSLPMSIGSGFDAFIKYNLSKDLGYNKFDLKILFNKQVDKVHWEWAWKNSQWVFNEYKRLGAYNSLLELLQTSIIEPRFEFEITEEIEGVPIKGLPDLMFLADVHVTIDFKVNGYCSLNGVKPKQTYVHSFPSSVRKKIPLIMKYKGVDVNIEDYFEIVNKSWAQQNVIYSWLMGQEVGSKYIIGIEQLAFMPGPVLTVACHRGIPSAKYQRTLMDEIKEIWDIVLSGEICDDQAKIEEEQEQNYKLLNSNNPNERAFGGM